ncbi:phage portal protein [Robiginitomaculum antarcticum]|uniref:phage portal protein n=1 Tax=Robiginitomaculum antarcticum TaxID=437507 RepID=UPI0003999EFE|nr:phage portal protein [Robiginitomaculum antarcticum]
MKHWLWPSAAHGAPRRPSSHDQKSALPLQSLFALHGAGRASWTPRNYAALAREGFQRNAVAYRCVRLVAEAAASVEISCSRDVNMREDDPAAQLLRRPHPHCGYSELMEQIYGYLQLSGQAVFQAALVDEIPAALFALRPDRVTPVTRRDGQILRYEYDAEGLKRSFAHDPVSGKNVIHTISLFHPTHDLAGFSPLAAAANAIDVHNAGGVWTKALLDNSARPSGALIYKGAGGADHLTDSQFDRLKSELEGSHSGPRAAGRPLLLEGGLEWRPMGLTPADMDFTEARREAAREIALALGVPPMLLGIPGDNTYANYREANQAFWQQTILPLVRKTAQSLEGWLRPWFGNDLCLRADFDSVPALSAQREQLWSRLAGADFLTVDEKRDMAGLPKTGGPS